MIADFVNPVIRGTPNNITMETDPGSSTGIVSWIEPTASDNSGHQTLTSNYHPGEYFQIGVTLVNYTSIDRSGNTDTRLFYVNIIGTFFIFHIEIDRQMDNTILSIFSFCLKTSSV